MLGVSSNMILKAPTLCVKKSFKAMNLLLKLATISHPETRLLSLLVDAFPVVASALETMI
jgi:hypothetical protein